MHLLIGGIAHCHLFLTWAHINAARFVLDLQARLQLPAIVNEKLIDSGDNDEISSGLSYNTFGLGRKFDWPEI